MVEISHGDISRGFMVAQNIDCSRDSGLIVIHPNLSLALFKMTTKNKNSATPKNSVPLWQINFILAKLAICDTVRGEVKPINELHTSLLFPISTLAEYEW